MALLPSTYALHRLRDVVANEDSPYKASLHLPIAFLETVRSLRARYGAALSAYCDEDPTPALDTCITVFMEAWKAFAVLKHHELYLRPLFEDARILELLHNEARLAAFLELASIGKGPGVCGTGHRAIGGALGVGKTYILCGIALAVSVLCTAAVPITFNYEAAGAGAKSTDEKSAELCGALVPISVLLDSYNWLTTPRSSAADMEDKAYADHVRQSAAAISAVPAYGEAVRFDAVSNAKKSPFLLLDEVNTWYRDDAHRERGKALAMQLLQFGRRPNVVAVVSGSSSCLREQLFAQGIWKDYQSLNGSLFSYKEIAPLRNPEQLFQYIRATGAPLLPGMKVEELLSLSGGVGRTILEVLGGQSEPSGKLHPRAVCRSETEFAVLVRQMIEVNKDTLLAAGALPPPVGIDELSAKDALTHCGVLDPDGTLARWRDNGLLLRIPPSSHVAHAGRIEFLYPYHAALLLRDLDVTDEKLVREAQIQLHGVKGSLGHSVEALIRTHLDALFPQSTQRGDKLFIRGKIAKLGHGEAELAAFSPLAMLGRVIEWSAQVGMEDFVLQADEDDPSTVWIDTWQCKAPVVGTITTWGDLSSEISSLIEHKTLEHVSDPIDRASAALAKVQWGFCALIGILQKACSEPGVRFVPRTFYLRTSAVLDATAQRELGASFSIPRDLVVAFNASKKAGTLGVTCPAYVSDEAFRVRWKDGMSWAQDLLPADSVSRIVTPVINARVAATRAKIEAQAASVPGTVAAIPSRPKENTVATCEYEAAPRAGSPRRHGSTEVTPHAAPRSAPTAGAAAYPSG